MAPKLKSLSIRGFRAYGAAGQTLGIRSDISVIWGPNSKGKTSFAEACEFLLTGKTVRRELMASSQDEFADALRNAHLPLADQAYVSAAIIADDKKCHEIKRLLTSDYSKKQDCASRLEIDGSPATEADLAKLGIVLSQPPLQAPVLAQHTLSYIFSVRPQDRATYFKSLLEVVDLDALRNDIASLGQQLQVPSNPLLAKFDACMAVPAIKSAIGGFATSVPAAGAFTDALAKAAGALVTAAGEVVPATLDERLDKIEAILADRRSKTFPIRSFECRQLATWQPPAAELWARLATYLSERAKVEEETRRLTGLFSEALKLPALATISHRVDCPLCATKNALTPDRVERIRKHVEETSAFNKAREAAKTALSQLSASITSLASACQAALPAYLKSSGKERRKTGFTVSRIRALLGDEAAEPIKQWLSSARSLARASAAIRRAAKKTEEIVKAQTDNLAAGLDEYKLKQAFSVLSGTHDALVTAATAYAGLADAIVGALNRVIDAQSNTAGWQDFVDVARSPAELRSALIERLARASVFKELETALKEIDRAKERVLDDKFEDYSVHVQNWWERLRPDEPTFFSAVQPRKGAKRTIDFKAGLSPNADRSAPKLRDVIAVFSQSQLHCLGLALFLARAEHEKLGFIVLDDPVLSSDEDYRVHFNSTVVTELLKLPMQVVILTQDHDTWEELETRYRHLGISMAQLFIENPAEGTVIENTSDALLAKINRAKSLARGGHPDLRKECGIQLRDAGERFCKEMLVSAKRAGGDTSASLTDYDGKTLEWLTPHVEPLLTLDASHPGKLAAFKNTVNRACHDNAPPANAEMTQAHGEIRFLVKEYMRR